MRSGDLLFISLVVVGAVLRFMVLLAYQPALLLQNDAYFYLNQALRTWASGWHPVLYSLFLKPFLAFDNLLVVPAVQHLLALGMAVLLYLLLRRLDVPTVPAALGVAPLLLDGYQLNIEQHILTEAFFESLIVGGIVLLTWPKRPSPFNCGLGGLLLGLASLTRFAGVALVVPLTIYLLVRRFGLVRFASAAIAFVLPLLVYGLWFRTSRGNLAVTDRNGYVLYGRVAPFADCSKLDVPARQEKLCPGGAPSQRSRNYQFWSESSPLKQLDGVSVREGNELALAFSRRVIFHQPLDYLKAVGADLLRFFDWRSPSSREPVRATRWRFARSLDDVTGLDSTARRYRASPPPQFDSPQKLRIDRPLAEKLRSYQGVAYSYGPLLAIMVLLGAAGSIISAPHKERRDLRPEALFLTLSGLSLLLFPTMFAVYHFRYVLPALPLLGPAAAIGAAQIIARLQISRGFGKRRASS